MQQKNKFKGYKIDFTTYASKKLKKLGKEVADIVDEKLKDLVAGEPNIDIIKMQGIDNTYRVRWGKYRIIFEEKKHIVTILVIDVGHRKEVYRDY